MDLSIVIVSWQVREKLANNLRSIINSQGDFSWEILVVDNNSQDGSQEMIKQQFPQVKLISNQTNLGFARACNQAISRASGDFILLLNPDMELLPDTLNKSLKWAKNNPQAVVTGIQLIDEQGKNIPQVRQFPRLGDQLATIFKLPHFLPRILHQYLLLDFDYTQAAQVDSVRGSYFLINRQAWEKISGHSRPLLDENYFIWFEEVDFCRQVYENKGEVWYTPSAQVKDLVGQSFKQVKISQKQKYFRDSMLTYFKKWQPSYQFLILKISWQIVLALILVINKFKRL